MPAIIPADYVGCNIEFLYNGKFRTGIVEKVHVGPNGPLFLLFSNGLYRSFLISRIEALKVR